jgi:hypothetical protein
MNPVEIRTQAEGRGTNHGDRLGLAGFEQAAKAASSEAVRALFWMAARVLEDPKSCVRFWCAVSITI